MYMGKKNIIQKAVLKDLYTYLSAMKQNKIRAKELVQNEILSELGYESS